MRPRNTVERHIDHQELEYITLYPSLDFKPFALRHR
jgi:hypothetical protein